ncbi:MAG TPA: RdgB/HAM1 family non-canonical purine NTP pyrophosphatase [Clostridiaceae bacterium]|nr:RdgB/HAM1 family non-canonical purine NTP pyrophosphatase [Clostridiaceae bacterium]
MKRIVLATHNEDKFCELKTILQPHGYALISMSETGFTGDIAETGNSYRENAYIKAKTLYDFCQCPVLADDTGLSIDLLDGAPGLHTARFAGIESSYADKIEAIWKLLQPYPRDQWTATFHCELCYIDGDVHYFSGQIKGLILDEKKGSNGFGYDPVFYIPELGVTTAEMLPEEKNKISHRGRALAKFVRFLNNESLLLEQYDEER